MDSIEKEGSSLRHPGQTTDCICGVRTPIVLVQMSSDCFFKSGAMTDHERTVGGVAHSVERTSHLFLSGPGLTMYEHCSEVWADPSHL